MGIGHVNLVLGLDFIQGCLPKFELFLVSKFQREYFNIWVSPIDSEYPRAVLRAIVNADDAVDENASFFTQTVTSFLLIDRDGV